MTFKINYKTTAISQSFGNWHNLIYHIVDWFRGYGTGSMVTVVVSWATFANFSSPGSCLFPLVFSFWNGTQQNLNFGQQTLWWLGQSTVLIAGFILVLYFLP
ncbi:MULTISPECIES: hypothetical protein [unclassified Nostoc]|uniref:hypothetical protein n=1 Tax=unclassified Nostoc TaxID=2593658 RepID=UPI002AD43C7E|nr:hypothetical protein [Nostoc sp. DedQUE03]MDZ7977187.1 hypothetical protein [Nostoc sp. DedQUE03]MDZ8042714.1 hypothetical protein [Nostoc sp. DedQUE02]